MVVIAARPSVGKTALALHIGLNMALPKAKGGPSASDDAVLFFSLEMSAKQLAMRAYSACSGINPRRVADGLDDLSRMDVAVKLIRQAPFLIHDPSGCTPLQMAAIARRERKKRRLKAIIVDYLQLIEHPNAAETPREQQVSYFSRMLKKMAKDLDLPVIVLCQLNREPAKEQRKPRVSDLRESGAIEQDADVIVLLSRAGADGFGNSDYLLADLAKHRNGPTGEVYLHFNGGTNTFRPATDEEIKNLRGAF
jgi:replicative DNA helicase